MQNALEVRILSLAAEQVTKPTQKRISKESQILEDEQSFHFGKRLPNYLNIYARM